MSKRARAVRWGVPVAAVAVVAAAVGTGPVIAAVQGDPSLPDRTAQQLLADMAGSWSSRKVPAMSGTVVETASLGLPALPGLSGGGASALSLLSGSHQLKVWYGDEDRVRLMLPGEMSETDLIVNGGQMWLWDSAANTATHFTGHPGAATGSPVPLPSAASPLPTALTPQHAAQEALRAAGGDTRITVADDVTVAGRAAYQVVLTPKTATSLVRDVRVAIDGETLIPLRVQVYAKGAAEPAFEVGFDSVTFSAPAPENFTFTPPAGAKVEEGRAPAAAGHEAGKVRDAADGTRIAGSGWDSVLVTSLPATDAKGGSGASAANGASGNGASGNGASANGASANGANPANLLDTALRSATRVSGPWGSGRLLRTKLLSVLLTDDGRLVAGAVTPEALYQAAGAAR
ncbi:sigma-E factor regulatory protein RseB domain-containing protein [Microbispora corallina]|uniref:Membrane protein n=1 Tax=Microbispora corallina TaxID=83302 RepID=A0ABQ4G3J4_9ACTN|nr:DUF2092 domain-containing protein [Microbispora corallina]GIH41616.1 membrane protein [Microbispora corallina]